ncbi:hypothetical protein MPTK1_2g25380 [Marchantia polymorpha subsp. ruderalis]|uniref:Uncharacterized protein n=1 Tax=Marchantia polymorpha TaxID=3197 RepID=A0A2R6XBG4_MARPO|nr:hypothetical protein MARPO_0025s0140 [Marchantia polymorpha]BBN03672.1 hypothetical protein Mp_2g25380 [Marchantia polymorpha subsp. ruderalis]|eukprot:PTQ43460.1 hypothetical protein MARPO_0025s0140 [Marchantia polymorpha]
MKGYGEDVTCSAHTRMLTSLKDTRRSTPALFLEGSSMIADPSVSAVSGCQNYSRDSPAGQAWSAIAFKSLDVTRRTDQPLELRTGWLSLPTHQSVF